MTLEIKQFDCNKVVDILTWGNSESNNPSIENYPEEGEISVCNGYVKHCQYVCKTSAGNVYKLDPDLVADLMKLGVKVL